MERSNGKRRLIALAVFAALIGGASFFVVRLWQRDDKPVFNERLQAARDALQGARFQAAEQIANEALEIRSDSADALLIAAEAATRQDRLNQALGYYSRIKPTETFRHSHRIK